MEHFYFRLNRKNDLVHNRQSFCLYLSVYTRKLLKSKRQKLKETYGTILLTTSKTRG